MTTTVIAAFGTRGDVAPYTGLARSLIRSGHRVILAAQQPYRTMITELGIEFRSLPGDTPVLSRKPSEHAVCVPSSSPAGPGLLCPVMT